MDAASILYLMQALGGGGAQKYNPNLKITDDAQQSASQFVGAPTTYSYQFPSSSPTYTYNMGSQGGGQDTGMLAALIGAAMGGGQKQNQGQQQQKGPSYLDPTYQKTHKVDTAATNTTTTVPVGIDPAYAQRMMGAYKSGQSGVNIGAAISNYGTSGGPGRAGMR